MEFGIFFLKTIKSPTLQIHFIAFTLFSARFNFFIALFRCTESLIRRQHPLSLPLQSIPFGLDNLVRQDCKFERNPYLSRMYDSDVGAYLFELSPNEEYVMAAMESGKVMDKSNAVPILSLNEMIQLMRMYLQYLHLICILINQPITIAKRCIIISFILILTNISQQNAS